MGRLEVLEQVGRRDAERTIGVARIREDGSFSYVLSARRPSRTIRVAFELQVGQRVVSAPLKLRVRAASTLRAVLRGRNIRFSGRVVSRPIPARGKRLRMQGRAPGFGWSTFDTLVTDRRGRFRGTYRLPIRRPGVRLQIRAVIPSERDYPYVSSRTAAVDLRVR
jgi:hypothetical protein